MQTQCSLSWGLCSYKIGISQWGFSLRKSVPKTWIRWKQDNLCTDLKDRWFGYVHCLSVCSGPMMVHNASADTKSPATSDLDLLSPCSCSNNLPHTQMGCWPDSIPHDGDKIASEAWQPYLSLVWGCQLAVSALGQNGSSDVFPLGFRQHVCAFWQGLAWKPP